MHDLTLFRQSSPFAFASTSISITTASGRVTWQSILERCFVFGLPVLYEKTLQTALTVVLSKHPTSALAHFPRAFCYLFLSVAQRFLLYINEAQFKLRPLPPQPITRGVSKRTANDLTATESPAMFI